MSQDYISKNYILFKVYIFSFKRSGASSEHLSPVKGIPIKAIATGVHLAKIPKGSVALGYHNVQITANAFMYPSLVLKGQKGPYILSIIPTC